MRGFFKEIYIRNSFFLYWIAVVVLFCLSFPFSILFPVAQVAFIALMAVTALDVFVLFFTKSRIKARRKINTQLSLGDENTVWLVVSSKYKMPVSLRIIDELPYQLQIRDFEKWDYLNPDEAKEISYVIEPKKRGVYEFHDINVYVSTILRIVERRIQIEANQKVAVYPSVLQMKKYELQVFSKTASTRTLLTESLIDFKSSTVKML